MSLRTTYDFTLPRGYVDDHGALHRTGTMRLATARDELEPLRDPTITGPDDPRLTIVVLARVVSTLGSLQMVTPHEIEGLFAADLAYLQDFYGVINFGTEAEFEEFVAGQQLDSPRPAMPPPAAPPAGLEPGVGPQTSADIEADGDQGSFVRARRSAIEEIPAEIR